MLQAKGQKALLNVPRLVLRHDGLVVRLQRRLLPPAMLQRTLMRAQRLLCFCGDSAQAANKRRGQPTSQQRAAAKAVHAELLPLFHWTRTAIVNDNDKEDGRCSR